MLKTNGQLLISLQCNESRTLLEVVVIGLQVTISRELAENLPWATTPTGKALWSVPLARECKAFELLTESLNTTFSICDSFYVLFAGLGLVEASNVS